jgi:hypothetical protein
VGALGHTDAAFVQVGTAAFGGAKQVVARRVVHHGLFQLALDGQCNADAVNGEAVDEVGRAVQGVDDPDVVCTPVNACFFARLFSQDAVVGVGTQQGFDDGGFGRLIDFSDEIVGLLGRHAHRLHVEGGAVDDGTSGAGGLDGHVEHGVQLGRHDLCEEQVWPQDRGDGQRVCQRTPDEGGDNRTCHFNGSTSSRLVLLGFHAHTLHPHTNQSRR